MCVLPFGFLTSHVHIMYCNSMVTARIDHATFLKLLGRLSAKHTGIPEPKIHSPKRAETTVSKACSSGMSRDPRLRNVDMNASLRSGGNHQRTVVVVGIYAVHHVCYK